MSAVASLIGPSPPERRLLVRAAWLLVPAGVRIGVARERGARLESHAWVESEGRVVVGDAHLDRYVPIATWGTR